jgi:hypothetical protein
MYQKIVFDMKNKIKRNNLEIRVWGGRGGCRSFVKFWKLAEGSVIIPLSLIYWSPVLLYMQEKRQSELKTPLYSWL